MYNLDKIVAAFRGLVGFEYPHDPNVQLLDNALLQSRSGILIGPGYHPLFRQDTIEQIAEQFAAINVRDWAASVDYPAGSIVRHLGAIYRAGATAPRGTEPDLPPWVDTTRTAAYLSKLYDNAVKRIMSGLAAHKKLSEAGKSLLANAYLYEGQGNLSRVIQNYPGRFVGLRISLRHPDTVAVLSKIGLQLTAAQNAQIFLFHSSSAEPLQVWDVEHSKNVTFQWHTIPEYVLRFMGDDTNAGGHFYIGYFQDDLTGNAIEKEIHWDGVGGCGTCSQDVHNRALLAKWSKFLAVQPFYVPNFTGEMWDTDTEFYVDHTNFGLNFRLAVQCDLTDWVIAHSAQFADPLAKQIAVDLLNEMAYSLRDNQIRQKVAPMAAVALDDTEKGQPGALSMLREAITALGFDFSDLSPVCNPCADAGTAFRKTTVWAR